MIEKRLFCGEKISRLGMGNMRLPQKSDGTIDKEKGFEIIDYLYEHGVNYYDTAYVYHHGESEEFIGEALAKYPRDTWYIASKTPGHLVNPDYAPAEMFERQLKRAEIDYYDFFLLHNVSEKTIDTYTDPELRVLEYFLEQKAKGRIKHLGISTHGQPDMIESYMKRYGEHIEFVQLQINYIDWTLQNAKEKYDYITGLNKPIIVMEPCRGGKLAALSEDAERKLKEACPDNSIASWAYRYVGSLDNAAIILSGISTMEQAVDNVKTFDDFKPLNEDESRLLDSVSEEMMTLVPCTGCGYCVDGCPQSLNIPRLLKLYNDSKFAPSLTSNMALIALPEDQRPSACIECGACAAVCPQEIDIPGAMMDFVEKYKEGPDWDKISRERIKQDRK